MCHNRHVDRVDSDAPRSDHSSPNPTWAAMSSSKTPTSRHSSEGPRDSSDHAWTSQAASRKRKPDDLVSPSRRSPQKSRRLTSSIPIRDRDNAITPLNPSPVASTVSHPDPSSSRRRPIQGSSSTSGPNPISPRRISSNDTTTASSKGHSKISQRLSLTQPVSSAKTRVKRNKEAREIPISSRSSSELPAGVLDNSGNASTNPKNIRPLTLASERRKRGNALSSQPNPISANNPKSRAKLVSPTRFNHIIDVIEIFSSDEDRPRKTSQASSQVNRRSDIVRDSFIEVVVITSGDESEENRIPATVVSTTPTKPKFKPAKQPSQFKPASLDNVIPSGDNQPLPVQGGPLSLSTSLRSPETVDIGSPQSRNAGLASIAQNDGPVEPTLAIQLGYDDFDMFEPDPSDCFTDPSERRDANKILSPEHQPQKSPVAILSPLRDTPSFDQGSENTSDTTLRSALPDRIDTSTPAIDDGKLVFINEHLLQSEITPLEADVAMLNLVSDGKDARDTEQSQNPVSSPSIPSPGVASEGGKRQLNTAPTRPAPNSLITTDPYPMTEGLWGFARRRIQRHTFNAGSPSSASGPMMGSTGASSKKANVALLENLESAEGRPNPNATHEKTNPRSVPNPSLLCSSPSSILDRSLTIPQISLHNEASKSNTITNSTTTQSQISAQPSTQSLSDVINRARMEYLVRMDSKSPEASARQSRLPSHEDENVDRHHGLAAARTSAAKLADLCRFPTQSSVHPSSSKDLLKQPTPRPCSDLSLGLATLHLTADSEQSMHACHTPEDVTPSVEILHSDMEENALQLLGHDSDINVANQLIPVPEQLEGQPFKAESFRDAVGSAEPPHIDITQSAPTLEVEVDPQFSSVSLDRVDRDSANAAAHLHTPQPVVQVEDVVQDVSSLSDAEELAPDTPPDEITTRDAGLSLSEDSNFFPVPNLVSEGQLSTQNNVLDIPPNEFTGIVGWQTQEAQDMPMTFTGTDEASEPPPGERHSPDDSDAEILVYPDDDEVQATPLDTHTLTEVGAALSTPKKIHSHALTSSASGGSGELVTLEIPDETSYESSTVSSFERSRQASYSRASSSDPIDLLEYMNESESSLGSVNSNRRQSKPKNLPVITWPDIRAASRRLKPKHFLARDLPHALQDNMNALNPYLRSLPMNRTIFEATISENTMDDEPDAPPVKIVNDVDDEPTPPWEFYYTNQMWHGEGVPGPDIENLPSCDCEGSCDPKSKTCACLKRQQAHTLEFTPDFAYDRRGRLKQNDIPIFECNDLCGCGDECRNRVVQHGRKCIVSIGKTMDKGWGIFAGPKKIPSGTYIGIYSGELLTDAEGEMRGLTYNSCGRTYLFDIDHHHLRKAAGDEWETKYVVDAYHAGNFTRFLNHSCDPNCTLNACYINDSNIDKPLLTVFTQRDVEPYEELCFSYSGPPNEDEDNEDHTHSDGMNRQRDAVYMACLCGAPNCTGIMFK